jgi:protein-ribulosamine 3-kinase
MREVLLAKVGSPKEREQYVGETESFKAMAFRLVNEHEEGNRGQRGYPRLRLGVQEHHPSDGAVRSDPGVKIGQGAAYPYELEGRFEVPTFCGATRLRNGWYETWEQCFDVLIAICHLRSPRGADTRICAEKGTLDERTSEFPISPSCLLLTD